ncbi:MAG: hypothetical protein ACI4VL_00370 [Bacilli bacterium]
MDQEKNSKGVITLLVVIIVILLALVILLATGTISFKSGNGNLSNSTVTENNSSVEDSSTNSNVNDNQVSSNWVNYLLSCHILEAKITRVRSRDLGDSEDYNKTVTLTMDDIKEVLSKLENSKLSKTWSEGRGGPDKDHLTIAYENNEQKYEFEIYYGTIAVDKLDDELKNILENSKYEEKNIEYKNIQGSFYFYNIDGYSETIFDKYFK